MAWNTYKYIILATAWSVCALLAAEAENFNERTRDATRHSPLARSDFHRALRSSLTYMYFNSRFDHLLAVCQDKTVMCITLSRSPALGTNSWHKLSRRSTPFGAKCWRSEESARVSRLFFTPLVRRIIITLSW